MRLLRKILSIIVFRALARFIGEKTAVVRSEIEKEEERLKCLLGVRLGLRPAAFDFKLRPTANGFVVPKVELYVAVSAEQLAVVQAFMDEFTFGRPNARYQPGMH